MSPGSPSKKRSKHLPSATPVPGYPIGKKENKKEAKERQRLERKEIKEREKAEIAERKRLRSELSSLSVFHKLTPHSERPTES